MKKNNYEKSFKIMIVELLEKDHTAKKIKQEYGLNANMVYRWRKENKDKDRPSFTGNGNPRMTAGEKEMARLKKAVSIFSRSDSRYTNS